MSRRSHRQAARAQRVCAVTGRRGAFHAHHVVREEDVQTLDPHDDRNALRILPSVHWDHHWGNEKIPLTALLDENLAFAYQELGPGAYDYLRRRYVGEDPRVTLAGWEPSA